jgi:chitinase
MVSPGCKPPGLEPTDAKGTPESLAPADGASLFAPAAVALAATADGIELNTPITKVEFFANGSQVITAVATDSAGGVTTSAARTITIIANQPPVVSLASPNAGQTFTAPIDVPLAVSVSDPDTPIVQVEYLANGTPIGSAIAPSWAATWANAPAGTHAITALATDALGATVTSAPVSITVGTAQAKIYYLHTDHLDTPRLVTDAANTVVWRHLPTNEPFGDGGVEEDPGRTGQAFEMPLAFPGHRPCGWTPGCRTNCGSRWKRWRADSSRGSKPMPDSVVASHPASLRCAATWPMRRRRLRAWGDVVRPRRQSRSVQPPTPAPSSH